MELINASDEYNYCLNLIKISSIQTLDWNRIKTLVSLLSHSPFNFIFINNIFIAMATMVVNETFNNANFTTCPYETAKFYIYQTGIPDYYDCVKINSLFYKYVLNDNFCMCGKPNCQFKPPVPNTNFLQQNSF